MTRRLQIFDRRRSVLRMLGFIRCLCLLLRGYPGAGGSVGPPTCVGGGGVRPFLFSTEDSKIVAYSLPKTVITTVDKARVADSATWKSGFLVYSGKKTCHRLPDYVVVYRFRFLRNSRSTVVSQAGNRQKTNHSRRATFRYAIRDLPEQKFDVHFQGYIDYQALPSLQP